MASSDHSWSEFFSEKSSSHYGFVTSTSQLESLIQEFQISTHSNYVIYRESKNFGKFDVTGSHKVKFIDDGKIQNGSAIPNEGLPFLSLGLKVLHCHQGSPRRPNSKAEDEKNDHAYKQNAYKKKVTGSKKMGCQSSIVMREVVLFPDFKPLSNSAHHQKLKSIELRTALQSPDADKLRGVKRIFVDLPKEDSHSGHLTGNAADIKAPIDSRVVNNIKSLVEDGIKSTEELSRHNKIFVEKTIPQTPSTTNRRFFPSKEDVRKLASAHSKKLSHGRLDQDRVKALIPTIEEDGDFVFFRPTVTESDGCKGGQLLFIYQSKWQRRLMNLYGQEVVVLDATYKTSQYALPLFFLSVKTNTGYAVVGLFIIEREDTPSVAEALTKIRNANPDWQPASFMIDNSDVEMNAINTAFENARIYLCDFHRKQSWLRWIKNSKNQVINDKEDIMKILNRVAESHSEEEYEIHIDEMKSSNVWKKYPQLQKYVNTFWLNNGKYKKWVKAFRKDGVIAVHTTNGTESLNKTFKYDYAKPNKCTTLYDVVINLHNFLRDQKRKYIHENVRMSKGWRQQGVGVPDIAAHKPLHLQKLLREIDGSSNLIDNSMVRKVGYFQFLVRSSSLSLTEYEVNLNTPNCTCPKFARNRVLCKHFGAVFRHTSFNWNSLPESYRLHPIFLIDYCCVDGFVNDRDEESQGCRDEESRDISMIRNWDHRTCKRKITTSDDHDYKRLQRLLREKITSISNLSYLCSQKNVLEKSVHTLDIVIKDLEEVCKKNVVLMDVSTESRSDKIPKRRKYKRQKKNPINQEKEVVEEYGAEINIIISEDDEIEDVELAVSASIASSETILEHHRRLERVVEAAGMRYREPTPGDGNCFFHAIVDQAKRTGCQWNGDQIKLRQDVCAYLKDNPHNEKGEPLSNFVETSWPEYLRKMSIPGTYVDEMVVRATAKFMNVPITIFTSSRDGMQNDVPPIIIPGEGTPMLLGHFHEYHYQSLEVKPRRKTASCKNRMIDPTAKPVPEKRHIVKSNIVNQQIEKDFGQAPAKVLKNETTFLISQNNLREAISSVIENDLQRMWNFPITTAEEEWPISYQRHMLFITGKRLDNDPELHHFDELGYAILMSEIKDKLEETTISSRINSIPITTMKFPSYLQGYNTSTYCRKVLEYFIMDKVSSMIEE